VPRGVRRTAEDAALQAARVRALEQGAAAVVAVRPDAVPATVRVQVEPAAPAVGVQAVERTRPARSFVLVKPKRKEKKDPPPPDPRGRGGRVDVRL
jgi:hypothetical protein